MTSATSPERLMQLMWGYAPPLILEAALKLSVFDRLDRQPATVAQLAADAGATERGMRILTDALVALGFATRDAEGRLTLTPESSTYLVSSKPAFLGGMIKHTSTQLLPRWLQLTQVVRTGKPATAVNREVEGSRFFEEFVEDLFPFNYATARALGEALELAKARQPVSVLDLAAGSGVWGIALAEQSPQVQVTAVDWPRVLEVTRRVAARHGVADRFRYVGGDLRDADFGTGHHVAMLGHILHSEGEARSRALLKKTFAALAPGGTAAVAEWLTAEDRSGPPPALIFAVNMLVNTDVGDAFSFGQVRGWLEEAGFADVRTLDGPGPSPLILATRPA